MKRNTVIAALLLFLALLAAGCDTMLNELTEPEELPPPPPPPQTGTLKYTVIVPEGVVPSEESVIRLAKDGETLAALNAGGFSGGARALTESIIENSLELEPGRYTVYISLVHRDTGKKKTLNRNVAIEEGEIEVLEFKPPAKDFLSGQDDEEEEVEPPPPGKGFLNYTITVPEGIPLASASRIRLEQGGAILASLNSGGFSGGTRPLTGSIDAAYLELDPGWYVVDILLAAQNGRSAVFRGTVEVLMGGTADLKFEPSLDDFTGEEQETEFTAAITIVPTKANSSGLVSGGSGASHTMSFRTPRGKNQAYICVDKLPAQTLTISGADAGRVSKAAESTDGEKPTPIKDVLVIDTAAEAETGGTLTFVITVAEDDRQSVDYGITLDVAWLSSLTVEFVPDPVTGKEKLSCWKGEEFDRGAVKVTGLYLGNETGEIKDYEVTDFDSASAGTTTVRFRKSGKYAADAAGKTSFSITILSPSEARLFFDYGRRISAEDPVPGRYTVTQGRKLVIAPVLWRVPPGTSFRWTVSGGNYTPNGEFLAFNPGTPAGNYDVTVTAYSGADPIAVASTTVECVNGSVSSSTVTGLPDGALGPGQFVPGADRSYNISLGGYGGNVIYPFSVDNEPAAEDFVITGNAFGSWVEPGIVWVMKDENKNGAADDTWYELRGNAEDISGFTVTRRYAVTYSKNNRTWEDNLGNSGTLGIGQAYPSGYPSEMTLVGTLLTRFTSGENLRGYVDILADTFDIAKAIHADGTPASLDHIDFVRVQTAEHVYDSTFGEFSTEIKGGSGGISKMWTETRTLTGVSNGSGAYTYKFFNNSGYDLTISFKGDTQTEYVAHKTQKGITRTEDKLYFKYIGGNVDHSISGNTLTFTDAN
jgi:hypothetical protein